MKVMIYNLFILLGISVLFFGCSKSENPASPSGGTGILKISMIDGPAAFTQVDIVIDSVQAHISTADDNSGWYTLNNVPTNYNLLTLVNGVSTVIAEDTLPAGKYSQIRLYVGDGSTVTVDGQEQPLTTPSGSQSGVKLNVDATILDGITYELTIDFDAGQSIVTTGAPTPKYILKPVIRVVTTATTGIISGVVTLSDAGADEGAGVEYSNDDFVTTLGSTSTDASGEFKIYGVEPGTYQVRITPSDETNYDATTITDVGVTAENTTDLGTIILQHK